MKKFFSEQNSLIENAERSSSAQLEIVAYVVQKELAAEVLLRVLTKIVSGICPAPLLCELRQQ